MENILTTQTLWENYDPTAEQLDVNVFKTYEKDGLIVKQLYFTGRSLSANQKTRVFATVCCKNTKSVKPAVLLVGDYKKPINLNDLEELAKSGFVAMAIDFAGRASKGLFTFYVEELDYCNADVAPGMFEVEKTARETKTFEYALNCRRAITYLFQEEKIKQVSLLTIGSGVYVGAIVLAVDQRLTNGAVLFGDISRPFPDSGDGKIDSDDDDDLNRHLDYERKRQLWTLGLAPQTYALQIKIPLYVINSANSAFVDIEKANKIFGRLNYECRFLLLPTAIDYITDKYFEGLVKWLKGAQVPMQSGLLPDTDENGEYCLKVKTSCSINKTSVWYCTNADKKAKYFRKAKLVKSGEYYVAKLDLYEKNREVEAFALFDREVAVSTPLYRETVTAARVKVANKNIFSGTNEQQVLIRLDSTQKSLNVDLEQKLTAGYLDIVGASGKALATFAMSDDSLCRGDEFALGFDVSSGSRQELTITAVCDFGGANIRMQQTFELIGDGKWQHITVEKDNFRRTEDGKQIMKEDIVDMLIISAEQEIIVNNIFLV